MQAHNILENSQFDGARGRKVQVVKTTELNVDALYLQTGQRLGPERLPERDRAIVVVSGTGELLMGKEPVDERVKLAPGVVVLVPRGTWHAVVNESGQNLVATLASNFPVRVEERG